MIVRMMVVIGMVVMYSKYVHDDGSNNDDVRDGCGDYGDHNERDGYDSFEGYDDDTYDNAHFTPKRLL